MIYIVFNFLLVIIYLIDVKSKANKGFIAKIKQLTHISPVFMIVMMILFVNDRVSFTTQVCIGDFRSSYFILRDAWEQN